MRRLLLVLAAVASAVAPAPAHAASGALTQLTGRAGCLLGPAQARLLKRSGCAPARGLGSTQELAVSPDGRFAYAISNDTWSVESFRRDPRSGALTQLPGAAGCLTDLARPAAGCGTARGLVYAFALALSPDGRSLYVTAGSGNAVAVFSRNGATGALSQDPGPAGCLRNTTGGDARGGSSPQASGCALVDGLSYPRGIVVAPSGAFVDVIALSGRRILAFARDQTTGALTPSGCAGAAKGCTPAGDLAGGTDLALTPDGAFLYATAYTGSAVSGFTVDPATGVPTRVAGPAGCLAATASATCAAGRGLRGAYDLTLARDGRELYVAARDSRALAILTRDPATGALSQAAGAAGCAADAGAEGCAPTRGLYGVRGVAVSPDGRNVYAGAFSAGALTTFTRSAATGALTQTGCVTTARTTAGCARARALHQAWAVTLSPDGRFLYSGVGGDGNSGLGVFRRRS